MKRAGFILLLACAAAAPVNGQTVPQSSLLKSQILNVPTARSDATAAVNPFDRFLMMTGTATLGAGLGTGLLWGASQLRSANDEDDGEGVLDCGEECEGSEVVAVLFIVLSPWIGASYGAFSMSGVRSEQVQFVMLGTSMFFGGAGTIVGTELAGGFDAPITALKVAGFVLGTGIGAALGATFAMQHQSSLLRFDEGSWRLRMPLPRIGRAPDGEAAGSLSLVSVSF